MEAFLGVIVGGLLTTLTTILGYRYQRQRDQSQWEREQEAETTKWKREREAEQQAELRRLYSSCLTHLGVVHSMQQQRGHDDALSAEEEEHVTRANTAIALLLTYAQPIEVHGAKETEMPPLDFLTLSFGGSSGPVIRRIECMMISDERLSRQPVRYSYS